MGRTAAGHIKIGTLYKEQHDAKRRHEYETDMRTHIGMIEMKEQQGDERVDGCLSITRAEIERASERRWHGNGVFSLYILYPPHSFLLLHLLSSHLRVVLACVSPCCLQRGRIG